MYGASGSAGSATLAATGLATGSVVLMAVGLLLAGLVAFHLVRKPSKFRP